MAIPYPIPDPATGEWDPFALKQNLVYLDRIQTQQGQERLSVQAGPVGNVSTGETTLFTVSVAENQLAIDGQRLWAKCWGITAANGNTKVFRGYWGGTQLWSRSGAPNNADWFIETVVLRTGTETQACMGTVHVQAANPHVDNAATTIDTRTANAFTLTGEGGATDDIVAYGFELIWHP